jgi:hypothetical protein
MKNLGLIILISGLTGLLVYAAMGGFNAGPQHDSSQPEGTLTTEADFRDKLSEIRMNKDKLERAIRRLENFRTENIKYLKDQGISKVADAKGNPNAEMALRNLKGWTESIQDLSGQLSKYDSAISRIDGMLKQLERERINESAGLTEEQEIEMRAIVMDLDDRMGINQNDILQDTELDELLNQELKKSD